MWDDHQNHDIAYLHQPDMFYCDHEKSNPSSNQLSLVPTETLSETIILSFLEFHIYGIKQHVPNFHSFLSYVRVHYILLFNSLDPLWFICPKEVIIIVTLLYWQGLFIFSDASPYLHLALRLSSFWVSFHIPKICPLVLNDKEKMQQYHKCELILFLHI